MNIFIYNLFLYLIITKNIKIMLFILTGDNEPFDLQLPCFSVFMRVSVLPSSSLLFFSNSDSLGMNVNVHWSRFPLTHSLQNVVSCPYLLLLLLLLLLFLLLLFLLF